MKPKLQDLNKYQKHYSDDGLLKKIGKTFRKAGSKVIYYVLLLYYVLEDKATPMKDKLTIIGALGYFIFPADMIPDFIPLAGFTDDAAALLACLRSIRKNLTPEVMSKASHRLNELSGEDDVPTLHL